MAVDYPGSGSGPIPVDAVDVVSQPGDFGGDGAADLFTTYSDSGGQYWARVDLLYGFAPHTPISTLGGVVDTRVTNFDAAGYIGISLSIEAPSSRVVAFYTLYGCSIDVSR